MSKIEEIRQLIGENRHADALNICLENFSPDEYTQEEIEQVYLWRIECLLGTILISEFGTTPGTGVHYEDIKGNWEYNPKYKTHLDGIKTFIFNLVNFVKAQPTYETKLAKYHKFQDYLLNLIIERAERSMDKYGELVVDFKSWENWVRFNLGLCFLDVFISRSIYAIGVVELNFVANDSSEFKGALDQIDFSKMQIKSIYYRSNELNKKYESISEGDYIFEHNADEAFDLLNTEMQIQRYLIKQFEGYEGVFSEKYSNNDYVIVQKKVLLSVITTALNAQIVNGGELIFDDNLRKELYEEACSLQSDINAYDPNYNCIEIIRNAPFDSNITEEVNSVNNTEKNKSGFKALYILFFILSGFMFIMSCATTHGIHRVSYFIYSVIWLIGGIVFLRKSKKK